MCLVRPTSPGTRQAAFGELPAARCLYPNERSPHQTRAFTAMQSWAMFWSPCCRVIGLEKEKVWGNQQVPARRGAGPERAVLQDDPTPIPAKSHRAESPPGPWQSGSFNLKKCLQDIGIEIPTVRSRLRAGIFIPNIALRGHARRARCRRGQEAPVAAAPNPRAFSGLGGLGKHPRLCQ